jgi:hypothetical protein
MGRPSLVLAATFVSLTASACASGIPREAVSFGMVPEPVTVARLSPFVVELEDSSYVAVLWMTYPDTDEPGRPITFSGRYPLYPTDQLSFASGRHRLISRRREDRDPYDCEANETPSLAGCRRPLHLLPGANQYIATRTPLTASVVIASQDYIDPYALAEDLYWALMKDSQRAQRLVGADIETVAAELQPVLLEMLGLRDWSASFATGRGRPPVFHRDGR